MQNTHSSLYIRHNPRGTERAKLLHFGYACVVAVSVPGCRVVKGYKRKSLKMNIDVPTQTIFLIILWTEVICETKIWMFVLGIIRETLCSFAKTCENAHRNAPAERIVPERPNVFTVKLPPQPQQRWTSIFTKSFLRSPHISLLLCQVKPPFGSDRTTVIFELSKRALKQQTSSSVVNQTR